MLTNRKPWVAFLLGASFFCGDGGWSLRGATDVDRPWRNRSDPLSPPFGGDSFDRPVRTPRIDPSSIPDAIPDIVLSANRERVVSLMDELQRLIDRAKDDPKSIVTMVRTFEALSFIAYLEPGIIELEEVMGLVESLESARRLNARSIPLVVGAAYRAVGRFATSEAYDFLAMRTYPEFWAGKRKIEVRFADGEGSRTARDSAILAIGITGDQLGEDLLRQMLERPDISSDPKARDLVNKLLSQRTERVSFHAELRIYVHARSEGDGRGR